MWKNRPFAALAHDIMILWGERNEKAKWLKISLYHSIPTGKRLVVNYGCFGKNTKVSTTLGGEAFGRS